MSNRHIRKGKKTFQRGLSVYNAGYRQTTRDLQLTRKIKDNKTKTSSELSTINTEGESNFVVQYQEDYLKNTAWLFSCRWDNNLDETKLDHLNWFL